MVVSKRRHADDIGLVLLNGREIVLHRVVDADVDDLEAGAFHHHGDQVLADVVDVALDGADDHLADPRGAGLDQQRAQDEHAGLHGIGGKQHFRHEQDAVAEIDADDAHAFHQRLGEQLVGGPAALQQDVDAFLDLLLEAVVEVIVHLLHQFLVVKGTQIEFFFGHDKSTPDQMRNTRIAANPIG